MKPAITLSLVVFLCLSDMVYTVAQTPQQVENAITFSRIYGYVRYFHPSDEAASIDWNRFALYGNKQVSTCRNAGELQQVLTRLFTPIAPSLQLFPYNKKAYFNKDKVLIADSSRYKTIAWQHLGVGAGERESLYKSLRTNRPVRAASAASGFAPANYRLSAVPLRGKEFMLKGRMRLVEGDGQGQLWARVDRENNSVGFFDNMSNRPIKKREWSACEIKGKIDGDGTMLIFGAMLVGKGTVELDDIVLSVKEGDVWKELYNNSFSESVEGKTPENLSFNVPIPNYSIIVKKEAGSGQQYASITGVEPEPVLRQPDTLFTPCPRVGEYIEKTAGSSLRLILPLALYGSEKQTFPVGDSSLLRQLKDSLKAIQPEEFTGNNIYTRLGDLTIAWNIFQHFYPYFDIVKTDWDKTLRDAIGRAYTDRTEADFHKTLQWMTAFLKDGHARVNATSNNAVYAPPIEWEWVEDSLVITYVGDTTLRLKTGDIVKTIDQKKANEYFKTIYPYISAATEGWMQYRAKSESLLGEKDSMLRLEVVHADNTTDTLSLARRFNPSQYYSMLPKPDSLKFLANDMVYLNIGMLSTSTISQLLPQLQKSGTVICDLRGYPSSDPGFISHLITQKDTSSQWMQVPEIIYPDRDPIVAWKKFSWGLSPAKEHLDSKIIFLIDGRAISYAESYMSFIENYRLATIVGQPTAGTNGNVNPFTLPGGYYIPWTGMRVQKHNGSLHHGVGILPDILVSRTVKGIREGRDEFLEKAIEIGLQ